MVFKKLKHEEAKFTNHSYWEEIPDEDLWEDGELNKAQAKHKMAYRVLDIGDWKLIRKKGD